MEILVVSQRPDVWKAFLKGVQDRGQTSVLVESLDLARQRLRLAPPAVAVLDLQGTEQELRDAVISLLMIDARVHTAVVSAMPQEVFHDKMEGLGILLALPLQPGAAEAAALLERLEALTA